MEVLVASADLGFAPVPPARRCEVDEVRADGATADQG